MARSSVLADSFGVDLRSATLLDGINTNVLRIDMRSKDKTLDERINTAQRVARWLKEQGAIPDKHHRIAFDFPVTFQVGCAPINLYERVQLETRAFQVIQKLPAQRVLAYDQQIRGQIGEVVLDDVQWNIPFFVVVDKVELSREVMGVAAAADQVFVSVHARWTNVGTSVATMTDDPWRLVEGPGAKEGQQVAILDGGPTHLARNGGKIKLDPVQPGEARDRWYVFRVPLQRLQGGPLVFARQRFAKQSTQDKTWLKAGFEVSIPVKDGQPAAVLPAPGAPVEFTSADWRTPAPPPTVVVH